MSTWNDLLNPTQEVKEQDTRYLRLDTPERVGDSVEVNLRVIDEVPVQVWRHWFDSKPVNCAGRGLCPACFARNKAKSEGDPNWKELFRLDGKYLINVAVQNSTSPDQFDVKIWSFGSRLLGRIALYEKRKELGDPRGYDMTLIKKRIGPNKMNVEYDLLPGSRTGFTKEYKALLDLRHDLQEEIKPGTPEQIKLAMNESNLNGQNPKGASIVQTAELSNLARQKGYSLEQLGINISNLNSEQADKFIADLKS